jgi:hypothetical protein
VALEPPEQILLTEEADSKDVLTRRVQERRLAAELAVWSILGLANNLDAGHERNQNVSTCRKSTPRY